MSYLVFQKRETRLHQLRYFLIFSITLSLLLPLSTFQIDIKFPENKYKIEHAHDNLTTKTSLNDEIAVNTSNISPQKNNNWSIVNLLFAVYFLGLSFFSLRLLIHLIKIFYLFWTSKRIKQDNIVLLNGGTGSPFTFCNWIFVPSDLEKDENKDILTHERIHASQYHSIDLILIELLSAIMWFNPLVWMMKKSVQLVHEYLADEGVLNTGTDKLRYQTLLLNQVAEERLICLSSGFKHSLVKKRMIMMANGKFNQGSKLRILVLIPLAITLFLGIACINGQNESSTVIAVEPVRMNVLYVGVDNPIKIAASGYDASDLTASIDNGKISGKNGEYEVRPKEPGSAIVSVMSKGKEIQKTTFRVKALPDPVAKVSGKKGGDIKKQELMMANEVVAEMEDFIFDSSFDIVEFKISAAINGYLQESKSNSNLFTKEQKEIIARTGDGFKVYIEGIKCTGPDGILRDVPTIVFKIIE
ncbi:M56 family metallopeptidase [Maribellus mangrovi]|uniref:M56 family metallopeptidase n=1 Tax=Maribellus mangrovi TaxID=3133146 RepID=UPI0030EDE4D5